MEAVLLVIHLIVALGIIVTILVQPSEAGGFMGNSGSMSNLMMNRRGGDVLTRATTILAGIFFLTSLLLAIMASHHPQSKSILEMDDKTGEAAKKVEKIIDTGPSVPVAGEKTAPVEKAPETPADKPQKKPK